MAFYMVLAGGTAGATDQGRYTSQITASAFADAKTDDWGTQGLTNASDYYYDSISSAFNDATTAPSAGDYIFVGDTHSKTNTATVSLSCGVSGAIFCVSVDVANVDQSKAGAVEGFTAATAYDFSVTGQLCLHGVSINAEDDIATGTVGGFIKVVDGTLNLDATNDSLNFASHTAFILENVTLEYDHANAQLYMIGAGTYFEWNGGTMGGTAPGNDLIRDPFGAGCDVQDVDMSGIGATGSYWLGLFGGGTGDRNGRYNFKRCKKHANAGFVEEQFVRPGIFFRAENCADTAAEAEYQIFQRTMGGDVEDSGDDASGIFRAESTAFNSGNKISFKLTTRAATYCNKLTPLEFDMPTRFADLTSASTDAITIYFACPSGTTLTDTNFWVEIHYPDATNTHEWKRTSSRNADILATGTTHTTDSGSDWRNGGSALASYNEYKLTVTSSSGGACVPRIRIFCSEPNLTMYVCSTVDLE